MITPDEIRKLIIEAYIKGQSKNQISATFDIKYTTVCSIIKVYLTKDRQTKTNRWLTKQESHQLANICNQKLDR